MTQNHFLQVFPLSDLNEAAGRSFIKTTLFLWICLALSTARAQPDSFPNKASKLRVLSFNILQGGGNAANVGFRNRDFGGSRYDEIAAVIRMSKADVVGVQEDSRSNKVLSELGDGWNRVGSIYSRLPLKHVRKVSWITVARVTTSTGSVVIVNCHWRPSNYGPFLVQAHLGKNGKPMDPESFEREILKASDRTHGDRGYQQTLDIIRPLIKSNENIVVTGDFNEPSHLDWTKAAARMGMDRWVKNPTKTPLRFSIGWKGSQLLAELGLRDAYRTAHPDETKHPGNTWTPPYPEKTPGRRSYKDQVLDRIDLIYFRGSGLKLQTSGVIGESKETSDHVFDGLWPSDHRAVLASFELLDESEQTSDR